MDKIVISTDEVASVDVSVPSPFAQAKMRPPIPWAIRIMLCALVLILPLLCLVAAIAQLATRHSVPRVRQAWLGFLCLLLTISGLLSTVALLAIALLAPVDLKITAPAGWKVKFQFQAPAAAEPLSPADLAKRVGNSVFIVTHDNWRSQAGPRLLPYSSFGTGALLFAGPNEYIVATCRHVVDGEDWETARPYSGDVLLYDREEGVARAQIVGRHKDLDLMLLSVPRAAGGENFAQSIGAFDQIPEGERIMIFGHPEGLFFSLSDGLVSRKDTAANLLQITAPVSPGASGGPVFDLRGRLLGIVTAMIDKKQKPNSENLNFAVRADAFLQTDAWDATPAGRAALEQLAAALTADTAPATASSADPSPTGAGASGPGLSPASTTKPKSKEK